MKQKSIFCNIELEKGKKQGAYEGENLQTLKVQSLTKKIYAFSSWNTLKKTKNKENTS